MRVCSDERPSGPEGTQWRRTVVSKLRDLVRFCPVSGDGRALPAHGSCQRLRASLPRRRRCPIATTTTLPRTASKNAPSGSTIARLAAYAASNVRQDCRCQASPSSKLGLADPNQGVVVGDKKCDLAMFKLAIDSRNGHMSLRVIRFVLATIPLWPPEIQKKTNQTRSRSGPGPVMSVDIMPVRVPVGW